LMFSTPTLIVNSAFSVFYSFWLLKRKAFTPHMFFLGIIFYILLSTPIFSLFFIKELLTSSFDHILVIISALYTLIASTVFIYKASKLFQEIEV
jgi:multisubunit Na+/H+ antiporter MnhE subunit